MNAQTDYEAKKAAEAQLNADALALAALALKAVHAFLDGKAHIRIRTDPFDKTISFKMEAPPE